jgi:integral membrane sensor domain MASE1
VLGDSTTIVVILALAVLGLELWRRRLRNRAAGWVHAVTLALFGVVAIATIYSQLAARHLWRTLDVEPGMKATTLANGISAVMWGYLVAFVAVVLAAVVLAFANVRARNVPTGGPIARVR